MTDEGNEMKAIVQSGYGSPDVLQFKDIDQPVIADDEVLVRVRASSLNGADVDRVRGIFLVRIEAPLRPKHRVPGSDVAGEVAAIGKRVTRYQPGDEVFGDLSEHGFGAFAEYAAAPADALAPKPPGMTFEAAATLPQAGVIALQGLRDTRPVEAGQHVLVNGAGGSMGTFAVQIAKAFGAEVTGVDSTEKLELVRSIGADHVIDYTRDDFTQGGVPYGRILDMVGNHSPSASRRVLGPDGTLILVGGPVMRFLKVQMLGARDPGAGGQRFGILMWKPNRPADAVALAELLESGKVRPIIERDYPLNELPAALRRLEQGHVLGKAVITV